MVRFFKIEQIKIPYEVVSVNPLGRFKFDHKTKNKLVDASPDREGNFQFQVAVDYESLPFSNDYLTLIDNYSCNGNFQVKEIKRPRERYLKLTLNHLI